MGIAFSYHETVTKLQEPGPLARGPFDRREWFGLLEKEVEHPLYATAHEGDRSVTLALMRGEGGLASLTNWFSFTWRPQGTDGDLMTALARDLRRKTSGLVLSPLPGECGTTDDLERAFRAAGWIVRREHCDENHVLPVAGRSFADYWQGRPGKMRTTLKRKSGKVEITVLREFSASDWQSYRRIYEGSWKPEEARADLLEAFARSEGKAGRLRLGIARHQGQPVAAQFWTVDHGTAYIHKLAHTEDAKPLSAGTVLSAAMFEHVIDRDKVDLVDFGTGGDPYKRDWMEECRPRYRLLCFDPRQPRAWPGIARLALRRLASTLGRG